MFVLVHALRIALALIIRASQPFAPAVASPFGTAPVKVDSFECGNAARRYVRPRSEK